MRLFLSQRAPRHLPRQIAYRRLPQQHMNVAVAQFPGVHPQRPQGVFVLLVNHRRQTVQPLAQRRFPIRVRGAGAVPAPAQNAVVAAPRGAVHNFHFRLRRSLFEPQGRVHGPHGGAFQSAGQQILQEFVAKRLVMAVKLPIGSNGQQLFALQIGVKARQQAAE